MGKNDFLSPKAIANRIKSKGLQKLRWYCQMCQKQCRDENGFRCHLSSESHKRQMMVFGENPDRVIDGYSEEFLDSFLEHLRIAHPSSRVSAKNVYNEFIADKHHIHMNSTKWYTLTEFVKFLGKEGYCKVDQTEKGWFIVYLRKSSEEDVENERKAKRHKAEKEEEVRHEEYLQAQIERAMQHAEPVEQESAGGTELKREGNGSAVAIQLAAPKHRLAKSSSAAPAKPLSSSFANDDARGEGVNGNGHLPSKPVSKQEEIMRREQNKRKWEESKLAEAEAAQMKKKARKDEPWIQPGIVVKVMSKSLKEHGYFKEKAVIEKLASKYVAQLQVLKSGDVLQVDQAELETVLPAVSGTVLVLKGAQRGNKGTLEKIDVEKYQAKVRLKDGELLWLEYEDISKCA